MTRKLLLLFAIIALSVNSGFAQIDFLFTALEKVGGSLKNANGYMKTIQDAKQAQEALQIINDSKCILDDLSFSAALYRDEYGMSCFTDSELRIIRVQLDRSAITIAGQVASNAKNVGNIVGGILSKEEQAATSANTELVSEAINDAVEALKQLHVKDMAFRQEMEMRNLERIQFSGLQIPVIENSFVGKIDYSERRSNFRQFESRGVQANRNVSTYAGSAVALMTVIILFTLGYLLAKEGDTTGIVNVKNSVIALIVLFIAQILIS